MYQHVKRTCKACRVIVFAHLTDCFVALSLPLPSSFKAGLHSDISVSISINITISISSINRERHKHKHTHKKKESFPFSYAYAYAYVALTSL